MKKLSVLVFLGLFAASYAIANVADNKTNNEALVRASKDGHADEARRLIDGGVNVNAKDEDGIPALKWAATNGHEDIVKLLIDRGADINAKDKNGSTALIVASAKQQAGVAMFLIDKGADVNVKGGIFGMTALMWASSYDLVNRLINKGADVNAKDNNGKTVLMWASGAGHEDVLKLLIDKGADVNAKDDNGGTALMLASGGGHSNEARLLLDKGADVNAKDKDGITALMGASEDGHADTAQLLIDRGADVNAKDNSGKTARDYAGQPQSIKSPIPFRIILPIAFLAVFMVSVIFRRWRNSGWKPNYVRVLMGWLIPAAVVWAICNIAIMSLLVIAFGHAGAVLVSSTNRTLVAIVNGGAHLMSRFYLLLSIGGCALSVIRYGDKDWTSYMKKTVIVQLSILLLAGGIGFLGSILFAFLHGTGR